MKAYKMARFEAQSWAWEAIEDWLAGQPEGTRLLASDVLVSMQNYLRHVLVANGHKDCCGPSVGAHR